KPLLAVVVSADGTPDVLRYVDSPVATFAYPESAARALGLAAERAEWLRRPVGTTVRHEVDATPVRQLVEAALAATDDVWLEPAAARAVLAAYGIPLVPERIATDADEALAAAAEFGCPVVVKSALPGVHKTESGGVALDLSNEAEIQAAALRIGAP